MIRKKLYTALACAALSVLLTACGNVGDTVSDAGSKVGDTMSEIGRDESEMMSRTESFLEGDDRSENESRHESETSSNRESSLLEDVSSEPHDVSSEIKP